jgi:hypothetical protein
MGGGCNTLRQNASWQWPGEPFVVCTRSTGLAHFGQHSTKRVGDKRECAKPSAKLGLEASRDRRGLRWAGKPAAAVTHSVRR